MKYNNAFKDIQHENVFQKQISQLVIEHWIRESKLIGRELAYFMAYFQSYTVSDHGNGFATVCATYSGDTFLFQVSDNLGERLVEWVVFGSFRDSKPRIGTVGQCISEISKIVPQGFED